MRTLELWVDGASGGRRGSPGGWAFVLLAPGASGLAVSGHEHLPETTNNRMELTAVLRGLETAGPERCKISICTDSAYVKNPWSQGYIRSWERGGWVTYGGSQVANQDIWKPLIPLVRRHQVIWRKVKGHRETSTERDNIWNCRVDRMAVAAKVSGAGVVELLDEE